MKYQKELDFIVTEIQNAYNMFSAEKLDINQKSKHDLVTNIDNSIENYLSNKIKATFAKDKILGEEMSSNTKITERTWTIDPIDGTCNMASDIGLYGIQCSLIEDQNIVLSAIYIPSFDYTVTAIKDGGCYFNGKRVYAKNNVDVNNAIVSFGDYPHKNSDRLSQWQHNAIKRIFNSVSRIRMFGSAAIDFAFVATAKTDGAVVITRNLWDIAPGILICKESGATVVDLYGNDFSEKSDGVIVAADKSIAELLVNSFAHEKAINPLKKEKKYDGVIFDFDGVILDTEKYHYLSWIKVFEKYGVSLSTSDYESLKSTGREYIIEYFNQKYSLNLSEDEKHYISLEKGRLFSEFSKNLTENDFIPYVLDYLALLKNNYIKIGIASSSKDVKMFLKKFGLTAYFDVIIDGNASLQKKPQPDIFIEAANIMNVLPENCLVFEDSPVGIEAAVNGGFEAIYVGTNHQNNILSISDFSQMI